MAVYRPDIPPHVARLIRHLPPELKRSVKQAVRSLSSNPFSGEPLLRELAGLWKYKVRRYRLIYKMDPEKLIKLLKKAHLVLGLVEETIVAFINSRPAPIAFIAFDLDYYTSTISAFKPMTSAGRQSSSC